MIRTCLLAAGAALALTLAARAAEQAPAAPAGVQLSGDPVEGKKLFTSHGCYQCHGHEGQGGVAGPRIGPRPLPLTAFKSYVRRPTGQMPLYTTRVMSDAELDDLHAFLQSLPAPPPVESIPLLRE